MLHLVGAIVTDHGSFASHAAIVSREMVIPAAVVTIDGTRRLAAAKRVRVNGGSGVLGTRPGDFSTSRTAIEAELLTELLTDGPKYAVIHSNEMSQLSHEGAARWHEIAPDLVRLSLALRNGGTPPLAPRQRR